MFEELQSIKECELSKAFTCDSYIPYCSLEMFKNLGEISNLLFHGAFLKEEVSLNKEGSKEKIIVLVAKNLSFAVHLLEEIDETFDSKFYQLFKQNYNDLIKHNEHYKIERNTQGKYNSLINYQKNMMDLVWLCNLLDEEVLSEQLPNVLKNIIEDSQVLLYFLHSSLNEGITLANFNIKKENGKIYLN